MIINLNGKKGGILQFELNDARDVKNIFYCKGNDIFFMFKSSNGVAIKLSFFISELEALLNVNSKTCNNEVLNRKDDSWFIRQLKNIFPSHFTKSPQIINNCCLGFNLTDFAFLTCERIEKSSDYLFKFLFFDPYYIPTNDGNDDEYDNFYVDDGDDTLILEGSLAVTEESLLIFYRELSSC